MRFASRTSGYTGRPGGDPRWSWWSCSARSGCWRSCWVWNTSSAGRSATATT